MNICLVSGQYPPENGWGGVATYTYYMATALRRLGHRVFVIAHMVGNAPSRVVRDGITILRVKRGNVHYYIAHLGLRMFELPALTSVVEGQLAVTRAVRFLERTEGLDIVEYADSYAPGLWHKWFCRSPYVVRLHIPSFVYDEFYGPSRLRKLLIRMERLCLDRASLVVSPSHFLASEAAARFGLKGKLIHVVPNPIDTDEFRPPCEGSKDSNTVLFAGWLSRLKGIDTFARAIPLILSRFPETQFLIAGQETSATEDRACRTEVLDDYLRERGVNGRVKWLGFVPHDQLPSLYKQAQICALPSRWDNFPYTCLEALSCGKAVVASNVGGLPDLVSNRENGILVSSDDPQALADGITHVLGNRAKAIEYGVAARAKAEANYGMEKVGMEMLRLYSSLL